MICFSYLDRRHSFRLAEASLGIAERPTLLTGYLSGRSRFWDHLVAVLAGPDVVSNHALSSVFGTVHTAPVIRLPQLALGRNGRLPRTGQLLAYSLGERAFDRWAAYRVPSGAELLVTGVGHSAMTARRASANGVPVLLDHYHPPARWMAEVEQREAQRLGVASEAEHPVVRAAIRRQEAELATADHILVGVDITRRALLEFGVPDDRILQVAYGANLAPHLIPQHVTRKRRNKSEPIRLLHVGMLNWYKGLASLLHSFTYLPPASVDLTLIGPPVPGWGPALLAGFRQSPAVARLSHLSHVPQHELVDRHFRAADVFVYPSLVGNGMVVEEALACGVPVIAGSSDGVITDGRNGLIVDPLNPPQIARTIRRLANDEDLRLRLAAGAWEVGSPPSATSNVLSLEEALRAAIVR